MGLQYTLVGSDDGSSVITVFVPGQKPLVAQSDHPNFDKIVEGVVAKDEAVADLFDVAATAATKFERLSDRITSANGRLYLDGEEINNALATQVVRFVGEGVDDWKPLVSFFENVQMNPQDDSRVQLYDWLNAADVTITQDGMIVGYKGVRVTADGEYTSINTGKAIVDGEVKSGAIPNYIGAIVEMPRNEVAHNPKVHCHVGLHVGTYDYANSFAQGALLEVHVHPRDVVSVPEDHNGQKMRVCRYKVVDVIEKPYTAAVLDDQYDDDDSSYWGDGDLDFCDGCGEHPDDCACENEDQLSLDDPQDTPDNDTDEVRAGDEFKDLDKRRSRTLTVTQVDGDTVHYDSTTGVSGTVSLKRLLTPYRFKRA